MACRKRRIYYAPPASSKKSGGHKKSSSAVKYSKSNTSEDFEMDDVSSSDNCATCCGGGSQGAPPGAAPAAAGGPSPLVFADDASQDCNNCCSTRNRSYTYAMDQSSKSKPGRDAPTDDTVRGSMLKTVALSVLSIVVPSSYANDGRCHHPRLKGGLFLMLNYLTNMLVLGVSLSYTIVNYVPNVLKGVVLPNPDVNIQVSI